MLPDTAARWRRIIGISLLVHAGLLLIFALGVLVLGSLYTFAAGSDYSVGGHAFAIVIAAVLSATAAVMLRRSSRWATALVWVAIIATFISLWPELKALLFLIVVASTSGVAATSLGGLLYVPAGVALVYSLILLCVGIIAIMARPTNTMGQA